MAERLRAAVIGTTGWGVTLALLLARNGHEVRLLARTREEAEALRHSGRSPRLPDHPFPPGLAQTADPAEAFDGADLVTLAVPAQTVRSNLTPLARALPRDAVFVSATKGIERNTALRISEVVREAVPSMAPEQYCALSGPNLKDEVAAGLPCAAVIASSSDEAARFAQRAFSSPSFRAYTSRDVIGVELAGALKNVIALGAGIADGLRQGDNAKAAFVTRGLAEITRLGVACGADPLTFLGLAGMGDLVATCYSRLSRNRRVGEALGQGRALADVLADLREVAEGVETTAGAWTLARRHGVDMPITEAMHRFLHEGLPLMDAVRWLLDREAREEVRW
ncbi:MAG TPA: NAD(P)H-dependent glycerol-3-phosphate dehydrogenase [Dehalococcoidia bacterium]|nr:NAD(P)H-dependent glycerol-3-phosphate dehydrogenase [Dehalococcoidia bacterium]